VQRAADEWTDQALEIVNSQVDEERLAGIRAEAERLLDGMRDQIAELNSQLRIDVGDFDLPEIVIPEPELNGHRPQTPPVDSRWPFAEQCQRLIASKAYDRGEFPHPDAA
jgi:hypothetical protein